MGPALVVEVVEVSVVSVAPAPAPAPALALETWVRLDVFPVAMGLLAPTEELLPEALQAGIPAAYRRPGREEPPADPEAYRVQESRAVRRVAACQSAGNPGTRRAGLGGCNPAREVPSHTAAEDSRSRGSHTAAVVACRRDSYEAGRGDRLLQASRETAARDAAPISCTGLSSSDSEVEVG